MTGPSRRDADDPVANAPLETIKLKSRTPESYRLKMLLSDSPPDIFLDHLWVPFTTSPSGGPCREPEVVIVVITGVCASAQRCKGDRFASIRVREIDVVRLIVALLPTVVKAQVERGEHEGIVAQVGIKWGEIK